MPCVSQQVLPPFPGAKRSVLQRNDLRWPGAHAQVGSSGVQMLHFI